MTPKTQFINKVTSLFNHYGINRITIQGNALGDIRMTFDNPEDDEFVTDYIKHLGLEDGHFYIEFEDENYGRVYEGDLDHNDEEVWDTLWECVTNIIGFGVTHNHKVGDKVRWLDPGISDYDIKDREWAKRRVFTITEVSGYDEDSITTISNGQTDAEVTSDELIPVDPNDVVYTITSIYTNDGNITTETRITRYRENAVKIANEMLKYSVSDGFEDWETEDGWEFTESNIGFVLNNPTYHIFLEITITETIIE